MSFQDVWRNSRLAAHKREIGILTGGAAALVFGSLALGSFALRINGLLPAPGAVLRPDTPVDIRFFGLPYAGRVSLDGKEVASQLSLTSQSLQCYFKGLPDGKHRLEVDLFSPLKTVHAVSDFSVDSTAPEFSLTGFHDPALQANSRLSLKGRTEPQALLFLLSPAEKGGEPRVIQQVPADADGKFLLQAELEPGWNSFVVRAKDQAGNAADRAIRVFRDNAPPEVALERVLPEQVGDPITLDAHVSDRYKVRVRMVAHDDSGMLSGATWSLDGSPIKRLPLKRQGPGPAGPGSEYRAEWVLDNLPEGERKLVCTATDRVGRVQKMTATFIVDSSERLGERPMTRGARGADVEQLQERLVDMGFLDKGDETSGTYDEATEEAVRAFQKKQGYEPTGMLVGPILQALGPRIFVNLSRCSLVLDRPGQEIVRFGVAVGQRAFPTPVGSFKITYKEKNPTWMPPNSVWAKEAKSIPPGPKNPLGTRWIGLDSSSVGIHGTNADWSIGSAASHGCLRMHIPDVERLFDMVEPGVPVTIYGGGEKNGDIKKYWP